MLNDGESEGWKGTQIRRDTDGDTDLLRDTDNNTDISESHRYK